MKMKKQLKVNNYNNPYNILKKLKNPILCMNGKYLQKKNGQKESEEL